MDDYQIIAGHFQGAIEAISLAVDELAGPLAQAADRMVAGLLADRQLLATAGPQDLPLAQLLASTLLLPQDRERPALPCLLLQSGNTGDRGEAALRALGRDGDVLLYIDSGNDEGASALLTAARERNIAVVALTTTVYGGVVDQLGEGDILLPVLAPDSGHAREIKTMALHCLVTLIENKLFGPTDLE